MLLNKWKIKKEMTRQEVADYFGTTYRNIGYYLTIGAVVKGSKGRERIVNVTEKTLAEHKTQFENAAGAA